MPAIITDQLKVLNCANFVSGVSTSDNSYYVFIGLPNATATDSDWNTNTPYPVDNFDNFYDIYDTALAAKRLTSSDVKRVIRKLEWSSGSIYEMYRHDYSATNLSPQTSATSLYNANYYVMNSDYRVYECLYNGAAPANSNKGTFSTEEPIHTDLEPRQESDGYVWKYLYTIRPSDIIKFDSVDYIPVPDSWGSTTSTGSDVKNAAVDGRISVIVINNTDSASYQFTGLKENVPIKGDGSGGLAAVYFTNGKPTSVKVTSGGSGYSFATLDLDSVVTGSGAIFNVIIPPPGGHGYDIYRELGAFRALLYARLENTDASNPDFPVGNQFARIGILKNPTQPGSSTIQTASSINTTYALRLTGPTAESLAVSVDDNVTQTIGVGSTAIGKIVSYDLTTKVLNYWQDRDVATKQSGVAPTYGYTLNRFTSAPNNGGSTNVTVTTTTGTASVGIDTTFTGISTTVNSRVYYFGRTFTNGLASPEIKKYSGDIVYLDNRAEITRAQNQREDIKIVLEF